jgi:hypothetical protein
MMVRLTDRTFIELLEYVRLKGALGIPSLALGEGAELPLRARRVDRPRQELEERVSDESVPPWSAAAAAAAEAGMVGRGSVGASIPFLTVADREPELNRCLAFGADATRRRKRVAEAPMPVLGEAGGGWWWWWW